MTTRLRWLAAALALATAPARAEHGLEELEALLNQPVYAASKFAQSAAEAPASVTVLTAGDIRTFGWRTLGEVLEAIRGVHLRNDRAYDYLGVRGISRPGDYNSRVLLLIDGVRTNDNVYDALLIGREFPLDVSLIERVEFIPGPGSALYGSNAVLGVVNVVTRGAAQLRGGELLLAGGDFGARKAAVQWGREFAGGDLLLAASAENRRGRDFVFPVLAGQGSADGSAVGMDGERDRKTYARLRVGDWSLFGLYSDRLKVVPTGYYGVSLADTRTTLQDRLGLLGAGWQKALGAQDTLAVQTSLATYLFNGEYAYPDGSGDRTWAVGRWWTAELRWTTLRLPGQRLVLGAEWQGNTRQHRAYALSRPDEMLIDQLDVTSQRAGLFVNDDIALAPTLHANLGLRADRQAGGDWTASPRAGIVWQAAPLLYLKALAGTAFREPNASERLAEDNVTLPNPALGRERVATRELALDWRPAEAWRIAASLYRNQVRDLIEYTLDPDTGFYQYRNLGALRGRGAELELEWVGGGGQRVRASASRQRVRDAAGAPVGNAPDLLVKLQASTALPGLPLRLGVDAQTIGRRLTVSGARLPTAALANATLRWEPPGAPWSVALSVYNLADREVPDTAGIEHDFDTIARDRRSAQLRVALRF